MLANYSSEGTFTHDNLIAGHFPRIDRKATIAAGAGELVAGSVIALDGNGKGVLVDSASVTPSEQEPYAVLMHAADASGADTEAMVWLSGHFNESALTFGGTDTADTHRAALRAQRIYLTNNQGA